MSLGFFSSSLASLLFHSIYLLDQINTKSSQTMWFSTSIIVSLVALTGVSAQNLLPECASACNYVFDRAGCGALTRETIQCFCSKKDSIYDDVQNCLLSKSGCSLSELISIRQKVNSVCSN